MSIVPPVLCCLCSKSVPFHPVTNDPPSEGQRQAQEKFATIHALVKTTLADTTRKAELKAEWKKQQKYKTLTGYVFHKLYHAEEGGNNG